MEGWFGFGLALAGFFAQLVFFAIGGTWALARQSKKLEDTLRAEHDEHSARFGESLAAIRQKINQVELWSRDEFIRREDFYRIVDGINKSITSLGEKIDNRTDRLETKIDNLRSSTVT